MKKIIISTTIITAITTILLTIFFINAYKVFTGNIYNDGYDVGHQAGLEWAESN
tara:strand:+ start:1445 stop:1606 length:162 start_codon:yes stop_codon:yes gene_type:complete